MTSDLARPIHRSRAPGLRLPFFLLAIGLGAVAPAREHVALLGTYTGAESRGIYAVRLDAETGALSQPELVAELASPEFLALHPNGRFVYAVTQTKLPDGKNTGAVAAFAVDAATGRLTPLNVESTGRGQLCHIAVDASGRMVVVASYGGAYAASFPIAADGRIGPHKSIVAHAGETGPNKPRQDAPHAHSVTISPDNRVAFVADLGLDRIFAYRLSPEEGTLAPHDPAFASVAPGAGPRHSKFSPDGKFFYVLNELDNTIASYRHDADRGALESFENVATLPEDFAGRSTASEIRVHPNGRFVYAANRGHQSLAVFARDAASGALARVEIVPSGGEHPRNFELTPDGRWLLCAHQHSNNLTVFKVDEVTGRLTATGTGVAAPRVVCVLFLR